MEKVRIGFIGVGGMAEHHMNTLKDLETAELTAVYDLNEERAKQIGEKFGAEVFASEQALMDSGKVDALYVCTPPFTRGSTEIAAAQRGIHLLSEKPIGLDMDTVNRISKAIDEAGIINSSGYCLRYLESVQKAKAYLAGKRINMVIGYRIGGLPPTKWFAQQDKSGGQNVEQSTHQIDLIRYLLGEFDQVQSFYAQRSIRDIDADATIDDVGAVAFTLQNGAVGSFINTCVSNYKNHGEIEVYGPDFYLELNIHSLTIRDKNQNITDTCSTDFYVAQNHAFVEAVRTGKQELVLGSYAEAAATLALTLAFNESAERNSGVALK
ncbi:Gfo/Idh/MocA family protein [Paenibacillus sp. GXUN7292]|uniref:Gfo/Idh/MocA family protein n=1 Tax=Paenibacillus sp. GXUN7292 TaxID=3422499 RepID=UPI003D7CE937